MESAQSVRWHAHRFVSKPLVVVAYPRDKKLGVRVRIVALPLLANNLPEDSS